MKAGKTLLFKSKAVTIVALALKHLQEVVGVKTVKESSDYSSKCAKFEQEIKNLDYEDGLLVNNAKNNRVTHTWEKFSNKIDWSLVPDEYFKKSILTHNHPSGSGLSLADVKTFINTELREIRAVTKSGSVYAMKTEGISNRLKRELQTIIREQEIIANSSFPNTDIYYKEAFVFTQVWDAMKDVVEYVHYVL